MTTASRCLLLLLLTAALMQAATSLSAPVKFWTSATCPYAQRVWCALVEAGVDFELKMVDLRDKSAEFEAAYEAANPGGRSKVPVLQVGDLTLCESLPVAEYVAEAFAPALLPETPDRRALARLLVEAQPFGTYFTVLRQRNDAAALSEAVADWTAKLQHLDEFLRRHALPGGPFFQGDAFTVCDAAVAPFAKRAYVTFKHFVDVDLLELCATSNAPRVAAYLRALIDRDSIKATIADDDTLIQATAQLLDRMDAAAASSSSKK